MALGTLNYGERIDMIYVNVLMHVNIFFLQAVLKQTVFHSYYGTFIRGGACFMVITSVTSICFLAS